MTAPWMPPLPSIDRDAGWHMLYTADQMRQAQADAARAALEQLTALVSAALDRPKPIDVLGLAGIYRNAIEQMAKEIT